MIARGPKTEDESCAIRMTPSKTPVLFGGGRTMTEAEVFKTWMGHIKVQCAMAPQLSVLPLLTARCLAHLNDLAQQCQVERTRILTAQPAVLQVRAVERHPNRHDLLPAHGPKGQVVVPRGVAQLAPVVRALGTGLLDEDLWWTPCYQRQHPASSLALQSHH